MLSTRTCSLMRLLTACDTGARVSNDQPRRAPARPKPLDSPQYRVQGDPKPNHDDAPDFNSFFVGLEKGVSPKHVEALNLSLLGTVDLDQLVPGGYLPPAEWQQPSLSASESPQAGQDPGKLSNGITIPTHRDFYDRAKELLYDTDSVFDSISGKSVGPEKATSPIRLLHSHRFYQHLLLMAEYWDTSKDAYTEAADSDKELYTGRRYGAGHEMPPEYREDTVCALAEMCIWPFRCNLQTPRSAVARKLVFRDRYLPIQGITSAVCASTTDRQKARKGILEGPLMGIHCRNTTSFRREGQAEGEGREELMDLLFEVGAALLVAQKRAREGKAEVRPGKDRFWADGTRRHLGELGGGKQDRETNAWAMRQMTPETSNPMEGVEVGSGGGVGSEETSSTVGNVGSRKRKQRPGTQQQAYLDAKPPESMWDSKVEYRMIGKEPGEGVDSIYLLSALNHHVSLVRVRVDDGYLSSVTRGPEPAGRERCGLQVERSPWYDLFVPQQRALAMRGVWGAVGWLMRRTD
ncbi:MAG: hypothetical protein Q9173_005284 [Seirophora scorigena]